MKKTDHRTSDPVSKHRGLNSRAAIRRLLRLLEHGFAAMGILFLAHHLCFRLSVITSDSMSPTLTGTSAENGDWVLTETLTRHWRKPARGEVIAFRNEDDVSVMKRVLAYGGERIRCVDGDVRVAQGQGRFRPFPFGINYLAAGNLAQGRTYEVKSGYYVLGDHSKDSFDSRWTGPVAENKVTGRPLFIVWPLSRVGRVR